MLSNRHDLLRATAVCQRGTDCPIRFGKSEWLLAQDGNQVRRRLSVVSAKTFFSFFRHGKGRRGRGRRGEGRRGKERKGRPNSSRIFPTILDLSRIFANKHRKTSTFQGFSHGFVAMVRPVVDQEPVLRRLIEKPRLHEGGDKGVRRAVPSVPSDAVRDFLVRPAADVALDGIAGSEMPDPFKQANRPPPLDVEDSRKANGLRVLRCTSFYVTPHRHVMATKNSRGVLLCFLELHNANIFSACFRWFPFGIPPSAAYPGVDRFLENLPRVGMNSRRTPGQGVV